MSKSQERMSELNSSIDIKEIDFKDSISIEKEIMEVYNCLIDNSNILFKKSSNKLNRSKSNFFNNKTQNWLFVVSQIFLLGMIISAIFPQIIARILWVFPSKVITPGLGVISIILILISQLISIFTYFKDSSSNGRIYFLKSVQISHVHELELVQKLSYHEPDILEKVACKISSEKKRLKNWVDLAVGPLEKVGIIPAIAALFFAYTKAAQSPNANHYYFLAAALIGFYSGIVSSHKLSAEMEDVSRILTDAINKSRQRKLLTQKF